MFASRLQRRKLLIASGATLAIVGLLTACSSGTPEPGSSDNTNTAESTAGGSVDGGGGTGAGGKVRIGFSGPAADHGWLGAINTAAFDAAKKLSDVDLIVAEGTNDASLQISQVETFINDKVDAIVLLPTDGAALTDVAVKAMHAGIPVINVDREFSSTFAARSTVLGDNYGMGVSAGTYICTELKGKSDAVVAEIAGIDSLPLTKDRSQGFEDALKDCGLKVNNRVAADFTVQGGEAATSQLLAAAPKIDAIWNHDDDQGIGVNAAIEAANRNEFFMVGGAGSKNAMEDIKSGKGVLKATVIYPSTQAADGIALARLIVKGLPFGELVTQGVPNRIVLDAPVVTKDNVDTYIGAAFAS
ncbi:sugar ABC transporter substrate-binding protein [Mycetocola tolaasinivorans]|uniref:Sugar ABC transporter substrate-binding protein n=1 Tax=Mycetocola tolaasinivorans TaxID=76635 RepID=A0A3L7AAJ7_9MICO|nr:substrate-binding domain-containing protein [Mycetocola tolaasinivorans]RLP76830.1 sugar ABC transporter substrate-binding protein [Mycetocola tolaasinivorans]